MVAETIKSGWVSSLGTYVDKFEEQFAAFCGTRYAVSLASGTVGLHLALKVLGIGPGDEVIGPDLSFVATGNTVVTAGATPVMVDVCRDSLVHLTCKYDRGRDHQQYARDHSPCISMAIPPTCRRSWRLAKKHKLHVIEDAR